MLFFLMKMDRKLRFQVLLLGLIVGVGVLPSKTVQGLKCYKCNSMNYPGNSFRDDLCETRRHKIDDCIGFCRTKTDGFGGGKVVERNCELGYDEEIRDRNYRCIHKTFPRGCYINNPTEYDKLSSCVAEDFWESRRNKLRTGEGGEARSSFDEEYNYKQTLEHCYCNTDLCNGPPGIADGDRTTPDPDEIGPRSSGVMTAFPGRLVLVGVTVVGVLVAASAARVLSVSNI